MSQMDRNCTVNALQQLC